MTATERGLPVSGTENPLGPGCPDGRIDPQVLHGPADVAGVVLERELGRVHTDHHEPVARVLSGPGAEVGKLRSQLMQE